MVSRGDGSRPSLRYCAGPIRQQLSATDRRGLEEDPARSSDDPYRTAMSMLDFYINRAGAKLSTEERSKLWALPALAWPLMSMQDSSAVPPC
jgi:hypothetical protein